MIPPSSEDIEPSTSGKKSDLQDEDPLVIKAVTLAVLEKLFSFLFKLPDVNQ